MGEPVVDDLSDEVKNLKIHSSVHPLMNGNEALECETAEEAVTTDSEEYLSVPLRYFN